MSNTVSVAHSKVEEIFIYDCDCLLLSEKTYVEDDKVSEREADGNIYKAN